MLYFSYKPNRENERSLIHMAEYILGLDAGCSAPKLVGPKGSLTFSSATIVKPPGMPEFKNNLRVNMRFELMYKGKTYILGEHAEFLQRLSPLGIQNVTSGDKANESALIRSLGTIVRYFVINEIKIKDAEIRVFLGYGNPLEDASKQTIIDKTTKLLLNNGQPHIVKYNDEEFKIFIQDALILPEGAAAYYSQDFAAEDVYIADAGSQTFNLTYLYQGMPVGTAIKQTDFGIEYCKKHYGETAAEFAAEKMAREMNDLHWPEGVTVNVCGGFAEQIVEASKNIEDYPYKLVVMDPSVPVGRKNLELEPIFANAAGLYYVALEAFEKAVTTK